MRIIFSGESAARPAQTALSRTLSQHEAAYFSALSLWLAKAANENRDKARAVS
jgi:hypothetical protein